MQKSKEFDKISEDFSEENRMSSTTTVTLSPINADQNNITINNNNLRNVITTITAMLKKGELDSDNMQAVKELAQEYTSQVSKVSKIQSKVFTLEQKLVYEWEFRDFDQELHVGQILSQQRGDTGIYEVKIGKKGNLDCVLKVAGEKIPVSLRDSLKESKLSDLSPSQVQEVCDDLKSDNREVVIEFGNADRSEYAIDKNDFWISRISIMYSKF